LADRFRVLEPFQRRSTAGGPALTVAQHVADLHDVVASCARPALVGHSWGAMLVLAYAAAHPDSAGPLVLVGCGTFDTTARARLAQIIAERTTDDVKRQLDRLADEVADPAARMAAMGRIMGRLYAFDPIENDERAADRSEAAAEQLPFDAAGHEQTWQDMLRLQAESVYPAAFRSIRSPVLMLHGSHDPHPGPMIRDGLRPLLPQLEYRELARCGHEPWHERAARDEFFAVLHEWLLRTSRGQSRNV
jgi:pimeloyl-ACP methyl ester carboxylesterase